MLLFRQRFVAASHCRCHVNGSLATGPVIGHKDQWFCGVFEHQGHLGVICQRLVYVGGDADRHDEMDVGQRVAKVIAVDDVRLEERAVLACFGVEEVETVGTGAEIGFVALQKDSRLAIPVAHDDPAGNRGNCFFHQPYGKPDQVAVSDECTRLLQQAQCLPVLEPNASAAEHFQGSQVNIVELAVGENGKLW